MKFPPDVTQARNAIVRRYYDTEARLYPEDRKLKPGPDEEPLLYEQLFQTLAEYSDRIPRIRLSICPYCHSPLKRAFDPWGLDGPWWHSTTQVEYQQPGACEHFRVLLGALDLRGRAPKEAVSEVLPGPGVAFVVPKLLSLPGMVAVVGSITMETNDIAYPIAYFSDKPTRPNQLHQEWCHQAYWYKDAAGKPLWFIANDEFDFELQTWLDRGALKWVRLEGEGNTVYGAADQPCPFVGLPGDRERQQIVVGERDLIGLPSGVATNPFEE